MTENRSLTFECTDAGLVMHAQDLGVVPRSETELLFLCDRYLLEVLLNCSA